MRRADWFVARHAAGFTALGLTWLVGPVEIVDVTEEDATLDNPAAPPPSVAAAALKTVRAPPGYKQAVMVQRCRVLEEAGCASVCLNVCQQPTQVCAPHPSITIRLSLSRLSRSSALPIRPSLALQPHDPLHQSLASSRPDSPIRMAGTTTGLLHQRGGATTDDDPQLRDVRVQVLLRRHAPSTRHRPCVRHAMLQPVPHCQGAAQCAGEPIVPCSTLVWSHC